jgi:hypothetical protein
MKKKTTLWLCLCLIMYTLHAQDKVPGSDINDSDNGSVSIALNSDGSPKEKIHDIKPLPPEKSTTSGLEIFTIEKKENMDFVLNASSAGNEEFVVLDIVEFDGLSYKLTDLDGRILEAKQIVSVETPVEFIYLIPSEYFIEVSSETELLQKFRIIKK